MSVPGPLLRVRAARCDAGRAPAHGDTAVGAPGARSQRVRGAPTPRTRCTAGMMNEGYFVGRKELSEWIRGNFDPGLNKVEDLATGVVYCKIVDSIYPGAVQMAKVKKDARIEVDFIHNFKVRGPSAHGGGGGPGGWHASCRRPRARRVRRAAPSSVTSASEQSPTTRMPALRPAIAASRLGAMTTHRAGSGSRAGIFRPRVPVGIIGW